MKGSRIMLALKKKLACKQNQAKIKRLQKGIEVALANAEEKVACAEDALDTLVQNFDVDTDVPEFIKAVSKAMYEKDEATSAIEQLDRISKYLFEELEVSDTSEEQK